MWAGGAFAKLWSLLLAIAILLSFPVAGFFLSLLIGWEAMRWIGGGLWTFLGVAYLFGMFLSIYVWAPSVKATTLGLTDLIQRAILTCLVSSDQFALRGWPRRGWLLPVAV
jgi:hypothetical protein